MSDSCPICDPSSSCRAYPHIWKRLREDPARWIKIHRDLNGDSAIDDAARAAALIAEFPPESLSVPIGRKCCG
jgi:hypothetical protein